MSKTKFALVAVSAALWSHAALAQATAEPTKPAPASVSTAPMSTGGTSIGDLLSDPASKAIVDKNLPGFSANPQVQMALTMTLKSVQPYAGGKITDENLAAIDVELAKLSAKK